LQAQEITTQVMIGFFLAFIFTLPLMLVHTSKIRHLFSLKAFIFPLAALGVVCWATASNGGVSAAHLQASSPPASSPAVFAWGIIGQFNAVMGANSALLVTVPDLARYSQTKNAQLWGQLSALPIAQLLCAAFGIITTSAVYNMWGELFWNPYDLLNAILDHAYTPTARAGVFFASASFAFATMGTSIACNIVPFAADVTCLAPKYVDIIRGQFVCLILAFAIVPWYSPLPLFSCRALTSMDRRIVSSANGFLSFLDGYAIFQGSVVSIMSVDYFLLRRGNLRLGGMFTSSRLGPYYYAYGVNWAGIAAFIAGFVLPLPGFISSFGTTSFSSAAATDMYDLGWVLSYLVAGLFYYVVSRFVTARKTVTAAREVPFEADVPREIVVVDGMEIVVGMDDVAFSPVAGPKGAVSV
jgi:nucleobase:cation symporter-1, NCS1 family